jgi:hypothetical protein
MPTALPTTLGAALGERLESAAPSHYVLASAVSRQRLPNEQAQGFQWRINSLAIGRQQFAHPRRELLLAKRLVKHASAALQKLLPEHRHPAPDSLKFVKLHQG